MTRALRGERYREAMSGELRIEPIAASELEALLPMIAAYQRFYEAEDIRSDRNRSFFRRFLAPIEEKCQ